MFNNILIIVFLSISAHAQYNQKKLKSFEELKEDSNNYLEYKKRGYELPDNSNYFKISSNKSLDLYDYYAYPKNMIFNCSKPFAPIKDYKWKNYKNRNLGLINYGKFNKHNLRDKLREDTNTSIKYQRFLTEFEDSISSWEEYEKRKQFIIESYCDIKPKKYLVKGIESFTTKIELGKPLNVNISQLKVIEDDVFYTKYLFELESTNTFSKPIQIYTDKDNIVYKIERSTKKFNASKEFVSFSDLLKTSIIQKYKYRFIDKTTFGDVNRFEEFKKPSSNDKYTSSFVYAGKFRSIDYKYMIDFESLWDHNKYVITYTFMPIQDVINKKKKEIKKKEKIRKENLINKLRDNKINSLVNEI